MTDQTHPEHCDETEDPGDSRLTELVAYLDGELDNLDADRLERQLVNDGPLRIYAESLDRTWRLLDSLGEATASGEFTQKTLASLDAVPFDEVERGSRQQSALSRFVRAAPWLQIGGWCIVGFFAGTAGLLLSRSMKPPKAESTETRILRQLDLLRDYQAIRPIPNVEFLQKVAAKPLTAADPTGDVP